MRAIICSFIGFVWLFPFTYLVFGKDNVWWVLTSMITISAIMVLTKTTWVIDKVQKEVDTDGDEYFYLYDLGNRGDE